MELITDVPLPRGDEGPAMRVVPPGPRSREWLLQARQTTAPMGPAPSAEPWGLVYCAAKGSNVVDVDGNRYVDLAAGFGAQLLGHSHPSIVAAVRSQSELLLQALGDVFPSQEKLAFEAALLRALGLADGRVILGQSGADAMAAALKTAVLATQRPGVIAFSGSYHGLGYGPVALCGLRAGYREPFQAQLNPHVTFLPYPSPAAAVETLRQLEQRLAEGGVGAVVIEPVLGRGGCVVPPEGCLAELGALARRAGTLVIADEIWTGLGRAGSWLAARSAGLTADLWCLGKGLGGGLPLSACVGGSELMQVWRREPEVVHTATFAGSPLATRTALVTLAVIAQERLCERATELGQRFRTALEERLRSLSAVTELRGSGMMLGLELSGGPGAAGRLMSLLLEQGYITSTGGGSREVLVLTPALTIDEQQLWPFVDAVASTLESSFP